MSVSAALADVRTRGNGATRENIFLSLRASYHQPDPLPPCRSRADSPTVHCMIRTFQGIKPTIPTSCFIEETGVVIGDVVLGEHCSVWFHAVIRGDVHYIRIGDRTNVQDLCMLHVTHDTHPLIIGNDVTIGHGVILHGCTINDRVLIGMGAIVMDGAVIGEDSVVGAGTLVVEGMIVPPKSVILGSPGRVRRAASEAELVWIKESAENYVKYAGQYLDNSSRTKPGFQV
jgi:carbonic anhydrase/acetyltransferase-like protein (isoleucine patch superfamily)